MRTPIVLAIASMLALAACGGGSGSSGMTPNTGTPQSSLSTKAVSDANALGDPVAAEATFNATTSGTSIVSRAMSTNRMLANGVCTNGVEFFSPDKNGDANSTEEQYFYDNACTELARDVVRIYAVAGSSETVTRNESQYALGNATAIATKTSTVAFAGGTYGADGFPVVADGFSRTDAAQTTIAGSKTIVGDDELVMQAGAGGTNTWCGDSAGYNQTGVASLNKTFGWQGGVLSGGTRTVNSNGSVTWQATHAGSVYSGAIGALSIATGTLNTTCPITAPAYTIAGGAAGGAYSIPVTTTFTHGELTDLTVTNANLANGDTLNVTTNANVLPTDAQFITGTVSSGGTQIATFAVDCFGDGILTVTSNAHQFVMNDWHVVR